MTPPHLGQDLISKSLLDTCLDSILSKFDLVNLLDLNENGKKQIIGMKKNKSIINDKIKKTTNNAIKIKLSKILCFIGKFAF